MKWFLAALALVAAAAVYSVPTFAIDGGVVPPECSQQATKDKHPDWYRDGGYCATPSPGATTGYGSSYPI